MTAPRLVPCLSLTPQAGGTAPSASVVAIGNFDGMHRGHQTLLKAARAEADRTSVRCGLVTFEPHPLTLFRPDEPIFRLTPLPMKQRLAGALGMDFIAVVPFDRELAGLSAREFVARILVDSLNVAHVIAGYDFNFGKGREGNTDTMRLLGEEFGFGVGVVAQVTDDNGAAPYSSSAVRAYLRHGRFREAAADLGYWWTLIGSVVEGDRRGREIGFPTANFRLEPGCELPDGIFAVRVRDPNDADAPVWAGAGYCGMRPTFDTEERFLEVHLLDFDGDLYGRELAIEFIERIRGDRKFDSADALTNQMRADCDDIRQVLAEIEKTDPLADPVRPFG